MNSEEIRIILAELKAGTLKIEDAEADILALLRRAPFEDLGFARVDHHRVVRQGLPEVIFGSGKTPEQIAAIAESLVAHNTTLLVTRATRNDFLAVQQVVPDAEFHETARAITKPGKTTIRGKGVIGMPQLELLIFQLQKKLESPPKFLEMMSILFMTSG